VLDRAVRLVEHNDERFAKVIRAGPNTAGHLVLAPTAADDVDRAASVLAAWPEDGGTRAVLARTKRELLPVVAAALRLDMPFRAKDLELPIESPRVDELLAEADLDDGARPQVVHALGAHPLLAIARARARAVSVDPSGGDASVQLDAAAAALLGWAAGAHDLTALRASIAATRDRLARLRSDDAPLLLATAHGTKGLEFDHVAVIGLDEGRFPSARSVAEAVEPERALEEERRLAYVAWTRARRSLTLVYDPGAPSQFLREAFSDQERAIF